MINTRERVNTSTKMDRGQYDLIKGDFSAEEALEIINHLLSKKIDFHELKSFSSEIRFGQADQSSLKRSEELKQCKESVKELLQMAKEQGKALRVRSSISIEFI